MKKKKWPRILGGLFILLVVAVIAAILYLKFALPSVPLKEITVSQTPENVKRGAYLANHVMVCMDCHSTRAWNRFSGPPEPGTLGKGGEVFDQRMGFPGSFAAANITPYYLKDWTDAEIYRAITSGVTKEGRALFPIMPYPYYGTLDDEDIFSIIAYLRTIPAIESEVAGSSATFPMNLVLNTLPKESSPTKRPDPSDVVSYGKYLVQAAACVECHTPAEHGQIVEKLAFSGGREFLMPDGSMLITPNITPDSATGIGAWSKEAFIARFKAYDPLTFTAPVLHKGDMQTTMPWTMYAGMDTTDLVAMYTYLHTLAPVKNLVARTKKLEN